MRNAKGWLGILSSCSVVGDIFQGDLLLVGLAEG